MDDEEFEEFDRLGEAELFREYRDVVSQFRYVVETERRLYLANDVDLTPIHHGAGVYFELNMSDVWVWDQYRASRFVKRVQVVTKRDINIEELTEQELSVSELFDTSHESADNQHQEFNHKDSRRRDGHGENQ